jgi:hypothetical protein
MFLGEVLNISVHCTDGDPSKFKTPDSTDYLVIDFGEEMLHTMDTREDIIDVISEAKDRNCTHVLLKFA